MPQRLYIIDGFAQIFRAYYAIRGGMQSPVTGEPTHAIFGYTGMLIKLLSQYEPDYVVTAVDTPGDTFRDELYDEYKANRPDMPEDLVPQIPRIIRLTERFGIPVVGHPDMEADDVIATITQRVLDNPEWDDVVVHIVSRDKDLEQLLSERVVMVDIHKDEVVDVAALWEKKGLRPHQVIDALALMGDSADNIPGVPGIGAKTAAAYLQQYESLEGVLANLDAIGGKRAESLAATRDQLPLYKELVTLKRDAPIDFQLASARVGPPSLQPLLDLFDQLGFRRYKVELRSLTTDLVNRLEVDAAAPQVSASAGAATVKAGAEPAAATPVPTEAELITSRDELERVVERLRAAPMVSIDTETTGLGRHAQLCGIALAWEPGRGVYLPVRSPEPERNADMATVRQVLGPIIEDPDIPKCGHNLKFDAKVLLRTGLRLRGIAFDSMLASMLLDLPGSGHKLDDLARDLLGRDMISIVELIGKGEEQQSMEAVPLEVLVPYAAEDADVALRLYEYLNPKLEEAGMTQLMREVEAPLAGVLAGMETTGITCDPDLLQEQERELQQRVHQVEEEIYELAGRTFNLNSSQQLGEVLFEELGFPPGKRTKTGYSTAVDVLQKLTTLEAAEDPRTRVPRLIMEYRQLTKLISTYMGNLRQSVDPKTRRIHTTFHQLVTATGRLASHNPNLQNIPVRTDIGRQIRKAFIAAPGHNLICADYSQVELRMLAHLSRDPALIDAFANDLDIHAAVASQVFDTPLDAVSRQQRTHAKTINFGIIYGVTPYGLSQRIEGLGVAEAKELIDGYKARFPGIERFLQECVQAALEQGYVTTLMGRRRSIPELKSGQASRRSYGERLAINTVVQGSAADLIKVAMVRLQRRIETEGLPVQLLLQIHDELVLEAPQNHAEAAAALVCKEMESAMTLRVPLKADAATGPDWLSAK